MRTTPTTISTTTTSAAMPRYSGLIAGILIDGTLIDVLIFLTNFFTRFLPSS